MVNARCWSRVNLHNSGASSKSINQYYSFRVVVDATDMLLRAVDGDETEMS